MQADQVGRLGVAVSRTDRDSSAASVGQHSAGPKWLVGGVTIAAKVVDSESEQTPADISQLKLVMTNPESGGVLAVLRLETKGGQLEGAASRPARFEPSAIPLIFLEK
jgi:hypothetical protein